MAVIMFPQPFLAPVSQRPRLNCDRKMPASVVTRTNFGLPLRLIEGGQFVVPGIFGLSEGGRSQG